MFQTKEVLQKLTEAAHAAGYHIGSVACLLANEERLWRERHSVKVDLDYYCARNPHMAMARAAIDKVAEDKTAKVSQLPEPPFTPEPALPLFEEAA